MNFATNYARVGSELKAGDAPVAAGLSCSRRSFVAGAAGLASAFAAKRVLASVPAQNSSGVRSNVPSDATFPADFCWGAATAAYQIEGGSAEGGRKPSVWDTFSHRSGRTKDGATGDVACDHYHRFEADVQLMAELGIKHYRFSISWPRILPDGRGAVNEKGVDFYRRLVDALLARNITPHATLFHWDSPQALEDRYGSWRSREMAKDFADYCFATVQRLGDRITRWMTLNEIGCFTFLGYGVDVVPQHAPGTIVKSRQEVLQTVHHALLAHGLGCQAIRAASPRRCDISTVIDYNPYIPAIETPENIEAARRAFVSEEYNGMTLVPTLLGRYDPLALEALGADAPRVHAGDLETIGQPLDSLGCNLYTGSYVRAADNARGYEVLPMPKAYPQMEMPWLDIVPESLYWGIRLIGDAFKRPDLPIYIMENGCATSDEVTSRGEVLDLGRIMFLRSYLHNARRAIAEGYPLKGYFHWSLLDNFEWALGYTKRFGLVYVDYRTQKRIPKESYRWYQRVVRQGCVV